MPRPGEVSLAHNGVLFLDELPEFPRNVLEMLRQPLEERRVTWRGRNMTLSFPARFMLIGAMNPCPCGFLGDPTRECRCTGGDHSAVPGKDQRAAARPHRPAHRSAGRAVSGAARQRWRRSARPRFAGAWQEARAIQQRARLLQRPHPGARSCASSARWTRPAKGRSKWRCAGWGFRARAHDRILKVARTVADLDRARASAPNTWRKRCSIAAWIGIIGSEQLLEIIPQSRAAGGASPRDLVAPERRSVWKCNRPCRPRDNVPDRHSWRAPS